MRIDWQKTASILFCTVAAPVVLFAVGKYLLPIIVPFLIAWLLALAVRPVARALSARTRLSYRPAAALLMLVLFAVAGTLLALGLWRLVDELGRLARRFSTGESALAEELLRMVDRVSDVGARVPFLNAPGSDWLRESLDGMLATVLRETGARLVSFLTAIAGGFVRALPSILLFVLVTVIAAFYFALDLDRVHGFMSSLLPPWLGRRLPTLRDRVKRFAARYLRAYLLIMLLTFCELLVGFTVLSVDYAFLLALALSAVDILPVLGVGTVLVPWSVVSFFMRDFRMGFGLLLLWALITVIRQILEPRIVGGTLGLHPLATLLGMYVGFRLFGIVGMLAAPAVTVAIKLALNYRTRTP